MRRMILAGAGIIAVIAAIGAVVFFTRGQSSWAVKIPALESRAGAVGGATEFLNAQRAVDYYRGQIEALPERVKNYTELATLFLQESRITGSHHLYLPRAQLLVEEALSREPENYEALGAQATVYMIQHRFSEALAIARRAVALQPHTAYGYGILCDALTEMGYYDEAVQACDRMLSIKPELRAYARASYLRELHGDLEGACEAMKLAAEAGLTGQEHRAWALSALGSLYLQQGKLDTASYIFNGVLDERPGYAPALGGLAQVEAAKRNFAAAIDLLTRAYQATPDHPFAEQLVDVFAAAGKTDEARSMATTVLNEFADHEEEGWNINREYARFCADHDLDIPNALARARKEFDQRPHNTDVLDTYAWTLYKSGDYRQAAIVIERALRLGSINAAYEYHAGMIYLALDERTKAAQYLNRSMTHGLFLNAVLAENARKTLVSLALTVSTD